MKEAIRTYLNRYVTFEDHEVDYFYNNLTEKHYGKKAYLLRHGKVCKHYYFIIEGLVRTFYIDNYGKERITQFAIENWWVTDMESLKKEQASVNNIQALEDTLALAVHKDQLEKLYAEIPKLERFFRVITENMLIAIQKRNEYYLKMNSKDLYESLLNSLPEFTQRVPQYMLASYLEITPEYLSELRRKR